MTVLPWIPESYKRIMSDMRLRREVYEILQKAEMSKLDESPKEIPNATFITYRDVLEQWKLDLNSAKSAFDFFKKLGVEVLNVPSDDPFGGKNIRGIYDPNNPQHALLIENPIDLEILGVDYTKFSDASKIFVVNPDEKLLLDDVWKRQEERKLTPDQIKAFNGFLKSCETIPKFEKGAPGKDSDLVIKDGQIMTRGQAKHVTIIENPLINDGDGNSHLLYSGKPSSLKKTLTEASTKEKNTKPSEKQYDR